MFWHSTRKVLKRTIPSDIDNIYLTLSDPVGCSKKITLGSKTFEFRGHTYNYFCHRYNRTWTNERAVEVPIIWNIIQNSHGRVLEVGNVLSHYYPVTHDVVDKYEEAKHVFNIDIVDFKPQKPYDMVISISTMEHVGWDETQDEPQKINFALENIKNNCLANDGMFVITCPLGYNPWLDKLLTEKKGQLGDIYFLKRVTKGNEWMETNWDSVRDVKYNNLISSADAIVIGIFHKK